MKLNEQELNEMVEAMSDLDFGSEIDVELVDEDYDDIDDNELYEADEHGDCRFESDEYDGQPDEYTEWQDVNGGDDWDHGQYDCMDY